MDTSQTTPEQPQTAGPEEFEGPISPRGQRILKFAVVIMGIMLVVGFMVVVGTIAYRAVKLSQADPSITDAPDKHGFSRLDVDVAPDTLISQIELDGNRMAVHVTKNAADEILIIDIKRGALLGRVRLNEKVGAGTE